jgi:hypothetical protein
MAATEGPTFPPTLHSNPSFSQSLLVSPTPLCESPSDPPPPGSQATHPCSYLQTGTEPRAETCCRKFGKQIQKRQLEVPEYAASFVNYKALKKVC